ncbi:MAG: T9SS type A sorting domain-containing protein [Chitinophagales bacterium]|nr:T9SS type A sorting domain-containing protein [Chitinophagales bacterium]
MLRKLLYSLLLFMTLVFSSAVFAQSNSKFDKMDYVKVYPNPVITEATIKISDNIDLQKSNVSFTVYNIVGKEILKYSNIKQAEINFSSDKLSSGMYIYQLKVDQRTQATGKFTVK